MYSIVQSIVTALSGKISKELIVFLEDHHMAVLIHSGL